MKNKKLKFSKVIIFAVIILFATFAIYKVFIINSKIGQNHYFINANFNKETKEINGKEEVVYLNNSDASLNSIYFHIYPNAYMKKETLPFDKNDTTEYDLCFPKGFNEGYMNILAVKCDGKPLKYRVEGKDSTILKISLDKILEKGDSTRLTIGFKDKLPNSTGRYGYGNNTFDICNWYPIAAVYDDKGWHLDGYEKYGDPFYSDSANYSVKFIAPKDQQVAYTGVLNKMERKGKNKVWDIKADNVRDFAIISSGKFKKSEVNKDGICIQSYYYTPKSGKQALKYAELAMDFYNKKFGKYPYKNFSVVESDFSIGGMEYPNLVMIGDFFYRTYEKSIGTDNDIRHDILQYLIAHEAGHQWWYGTVGNNEVDEAWLDESLTEYSTELYYEGVYGRTTMEKMYNAMVLDEYRQLLPYVKEKNIDRSLNQFNSTEEYTALVYNRGCIIFNNLREHMGDKMFFDALEKYYNDYKFKNATAKSFIDICSEVSGKDYSKIINDWIEGRSTVDFKI